MLLSCWVSNVQAVCPSLATATRFTLNGAVVTDKVTGLLWARCSLGQTWTGSICTGVASTFTHEQALQYAQVQSGWRLPNVKELSSLVDRGCLSLAIDPVAFPGTPPASYWSSSPDAADSTIAWSVAFDTGGVENYNGRSFNLHVRLVRTSQ